MAKTNKNNEKGHRAHAIIKCHVPFYSSSFFDPEGTTEEGEVKNHKDKMVKIPIKIAADGDESRSNVTSFEIKGINHFDNNVEAVLETFMELNERVIKPKGITDSKEECKTVIKLLHLLCMTGAATQTLQEATKMARTRVVHTILALNHPSLSDQEGTLISNEKNFYECIEGTFDDLDKEVFQDDETYSNHLFGEYNRYFWNHLNSIIFGADAYRAYKEQKKYLMNQIVKPFGISVESAFRRVEIIANMMEYFPPPCSNGKEPTRVQWNRFSQIKKLTEEEKREIKYNLLPLSFRERIDDSNEDWTEWSSVKFLAQVQKCEAIDHCENEKRNKEKNKEKGKRKRDDDDESSTSNLSRSQRDRNQKTKKKREGSDTSSAGKARLCELCKLAGAPEFVYTTHNTNQCRKKERYAQTLSGGAGSRKSASKELKSMEKKLLKGLKLVQKKQKKLARKDDKSDDSDVDTDGSY